MVLPAAVFITVALIGLIMGFHFQLLEQIEEHGKARDQLYLMRETDGLRIADSLSDAAGSALNKTAES